LKSVVWSID